MAELDLKPLPPEEAIKYFQGKGYRFSWRWHEMWHEDHTKAFTVAKAARLDILQDIRGELDRALLSGTTFDAFKKRLTPTLQQKGWWGKKIIGEGGAAKLVQLGSPRRLATIFNVNVQTAYQVGHYRAMSDPDVLKARPYWRYVAVNDGRTRPQHLAWMNTVLPANHPWFETHYPPNGWNCRCTVVSLSEAEMKRDGLKITELPDNRQARRFNPKTGRYETFPAGIDPGWDYNPGKESLLWDREQASRAMDILPGQKAWKDYGRPDLRAVPKAARMAEPPMLRAGRDEKEAVETLRKTFGMSAEKNFLDVATADGDKAVIHADLLPHMVAKRQETRERYGNFLLETLKNPYEIWLTDFEDGLRKQYVGIFSGKSDLAVTARLNRDGSVVWNMMKAGDKKMNGHRLGTLIYGK